MEVEPFESKIQVEEVSPKRSISERLLFKISAIINSLLTKVRFDVGELLMTNLTEIQFQSKYGTNWVLCNGQNIENTLLASLEGIAFAPDYRSEFLVQNNNSDSGVDSGRTLGSFQSHGNAPHSHFILTTGQNPSNNPHIYYNFRNQAFSSPSTYRYHSSSGTPNAGTTYDGDVSTPNSDANGMRPVNIAFNYMIKVN